MNVENSFASKGLAGSALGLSIGGLALAATNGCNGGLLGNLLGGNNCRKDDGIATAAAMTAMAAAMSNGGCGHGCSENTPVNRYELDLQQQLAAEKSKTALLESNAYTDQKLSDVYARLESQVKELAREVRANKDEQTGINTQQAVYNGANTATIACMQGQIADLLALTKRVVPNTSVCPGWGNVTITPAAAAAAGA